MLAASESKHSSTSAIEKKNSHYISERNLAKSKIVGSEKTF